MKYKKYLQVVLKKYIYNIVILYNIKDLLNLVDDLRRYILHHHFSES